MRCIGVFLYLFLHLTSLMSAIAMSAKPVVVRIISDLV
jgi:hypothetical protein